MQLEIGKVLEGKVTGITKFGAFIELEPGKVGMVHISEIAPTYVSDIADHITDGQMVKVKILAITDEGKISLSIKKAIEGAPQQDSRPQARPNQQGGNFSRGNSDGGGRPRAPQQGSRDGGGQRSFPPRGGNGGSAGGSANGNFGGNRGRQGGYGATSPKGGNAFEDMLSKFMQSSDEKISDIKKSHEVNRRAGAKRSK